MPHRSIFLRSLLLAGLLAGAGMGCGSKWSIEDADDDGVASDRDCWDHPEGPTGSGLRGADIYPGSSETWYDGVDQDCGGDDDYDADQDGFVPNGFEGLATLGVPGSGGLPGGDCWDDPNDTPASFLVVSSAFRDAEGSPLNWTQPEPGRVHPGASDAWYDGVDQDCEGNDDFDQDGDGFASSAYPDQDGAFGPDCFDGAPIDVGSPTGKRPEDVNPEATEVWYDGTDDDCDGNDCDQDGDGYARDGATRYDPRQGYCPMEECDDSDADVFPDLSVPEIWYNGLDENCDSNDGDRDGDGFWASDYEARVKASGSGADPYEIPAGMAGDCWDDWEPGEPVPAEQAVVSSKFRDKFGGILAWTQPEAADVYPGAPDVPYDGLDADCDGGDDLDQDGDGWRTDWYPDRDGLFGEDCYDASETDSATDPAVASPKAPSAVNPGASESWYDGTDDDCDGNDCDRDGDGFCLETYTYDPGALPLGDCVDYGATASGIHPGATELPADSVDQDCDDRELCYDDLDNDGHVALGRPTHTSSSLSCAASGDGLASEPADDCNDAAATVHPGATENPDNGVDETCDGTELCYDDLDNDGHVALTGSTHTSSSLTCAASGDGKATEPADDCDDALASIYPGATEVVADGTDQDCSGGDTCYRDNDGDRYGTTTTVVSSDLDCLDTGESSVSTDCMDSGTNAAYAFPGAASRDSTTACMMDYDGDDYGSTTAPSGGTAGTDCNDAAASVYPSATEIVADGVDQDCSGGDTCYRDSDGDGYGTSTTVVSGDLDCTDANESAYATDCLDSGTNARYAFPGSAERESATSCMMDYDGDGYGSTTAPGTGTAGTDCNDSSSSVNPGATETADNGVDQNCDGYELCYDDLDNDGHVATGATTHTSSSLTCAASGDGKATEPADDCNDAVASIYTGATEVVADGVDQDCSGGDTCYRDSDGDGYGTTTTVVSSDLDCTDANESAYATDCLDSGTNARYAFPGSAERESATYCMMDYDGDGYGSTTAPGTGRAGTDCNDSGATIYPGATETPDNGVDQNCDGYELCYDDLDNDGHVATAGTTHTSSSLTCAASGDGKATEPTDDCNDASAAIYPGATEVVADGVDQDCSGGDTCYLDADHDGYGTTATVVSADLDCVDVGEALNTTDCNDAASGVNPGVATDDESSLLVDNDCDQYVDEDAITYGSLVISEIMKDVRLAGGSSPDVTDAHWFEVYNTESFDISLANWVVRACATSGFTVANTPSFDATCATTSVAVSPDAGTPIVVPAGGYAVLCQSKSYGNLSTTCDYEIGASWSGSWEGVPYRHSALLYRTYNGVLELSLDGSLVDEVGWYYVSTADTWPYQAKYAMCVRTGYLDADLNNLKANWGKSTGTSWIAASAPVPTNYGSPGAANTCTAM